jgi:hypothetical protein
LRSHDSIALHTKADWTAVLALSTLWDFASIRFWAIRELLDLTTPVDRLVLARDFAVNEWRADAFLNVCLAPSWPSDDDCRRLGMETMIKVGCAREALRTPGQLVPSAQHATIIANVFDISAGDSVHEQSTGHLATSNASSPSGTIPDFDAGLERQVPRRSCLSIFLFANLLLKDADCSLVLYMRELVQARRWESLYAPYSTHKDVSVLHSEIDKTQKWMDSAEYQGVSASEIKAQHMHLESLARTIIERYQEAKDRAVAVSQLQQDIRLYGAKAGYARSNAEIALHQLEALLDDKLFLKAQCDEATRWLDRVLADQQRLPKYEEPVLTAHLLFSSEAGSAHRGVTFGVWRPFGAVVYANVVVCISFSFSIAMDHLTYMYLQSIGLIKSL